MMAKQVNPGTPNEFSALPFTSGDLKILEASFGEWSGKAEDSIKAERDKRVAELRRAFRQAGAFEGDKKLRAEKITLWGEEHNAADRSRLTREAHARLAGVQRALGEVRYRAELAAAIDSANSGGDDSDLERLLGGAPGYTDGGQPLPPVETQALSTAPESIASQLIGDGAAMDKLVSQLSALQPDPSDSVSVRAEGEAARGLMAAVLMESGATGWAQETRREPGYLPAISRPVRLLDLLEMRRTTLNSVTYMEMTMRNNAAGNVAEGAAAPQVDWDFEEKTVNLVDIAAHAALTRQQLTDVPEVEGVVNMDLPLMVRQKTETDVVSGSGSSNQMTGILNWASTKAYTLGEKPANAGPSDFLVDFHKAIEKLEVESYVTPDISVLHNYLWGEAVRSETASAGFYGGSPFGPQFQKILWGVPVVTHPIFDYAHGKKVGFMAQARGNVLIRLLEDIMVTWGWANDDFLRRQYRALCTIRGALQIYRPEYVLVMSRGSV